MSAIAFDTLKYTKKLEEAGIPRKQAEAQAEITAEVFNDIIDDSLSTKQDIKSIEVKMESVRNDLEVKMESIKVDLIKWVIGLLFAQTALILTLH